MLMNEELKKRRAFFDTYSSREPEREADAPPCGVRFSCPCCGYPTLEERKCFEICELCGWEDDGQDDSDAEIVFGGPNGSYSLQDARANFERYLDMYALDDACSANRRESKANLQMKRNLINIFERMREEPPATVLNDLWREVRRYEHALFFGPRANLPE